MNGSGHEVDLEDDERNPLATLQLEGFDSHGTTRTPYANRWIEVEHGIPGETVIAEIVGQKRLQGRIREILEPSPERTDPPCPYFREWQCGGCQWQHITYEGQIQHKRDDVVAAMREAQLPFSISATHTLSDPWRYRSTAGISLGKHAGFRRHGSLAIVPIRDCPISDPLIGRLMASLNDLLEEGTLPNFRGRLRLDVRVAEEGGVRRLQVLLRPLEEGKEPPVEDTRVLAATLAGMDLVSGVSLARPGRPLETISGQRFAVVPVNDHPVFLSAASFFQTNLRLLPTLIDRLLEEARPLTDRRVADVYGGVGIFGLFLASEAREVLVIESDALAVDAGRRTAQAWNLANVRFLKAQAEEALQEMEGSDVVILDPPRRGLTEPVLAALLRTQPPLILYVSCLAQSLARDLAVLTEHYSVEHLELFDFYPQTYHVEILAVLRVRPAN